MNEEWPDDEGSQQLRGGWHAATKSAGKGSGRARPRLMISPGSWVPVVLVGVNMPVMKCNIFAAISVALSLFVAACDSGPSKTEAEKIIRDAVGKEIAAAGMATMGLAKAKLISLKIGEIKKSDNKNIWLVTVKTKAEVSALGQTMAEESEDLIKLKKGEDGKFSLVK